MKRDTNILMHANDTNILILVSLVYSHRVIIKDIVSIRETMSFWSQFFF